LRPSVVSGPEVRQILVFELYDQDPAPGQRETKIGSNLRDIAKGGSPLNAPCAAGSTAGQTIAVDSGGQNLQVVIKPEKGGWHSVKAATSLVTADPLERVEITVLEPESGLFYLPAVSGSGGKERD